MLNLGVSTFCCAKCEIIYTIGYGSDYASATEGNSEKILKPPFLKSTFMDFHFLGFCATVHFEAIKSNLLKKKYILQ